MDRRLPICDTCIGLKEGLDPPNTYVGEKVPRNGSRQEIKCLNLCDNVRTCKRCSNKICPQIATCSTSCKNQYDTCDRCSNVPTKFHNFWCPKIMALFAPEYYQGNFTIFNNIYGERKFTSAQFFLVSLFSYSYNYIILVNISTIHAWASHYLLFHLLLL